MVFSGPTATYGQIRFRIGCEYCGIYQRKAEEHEQCRSQYPTHAVMIHPCQKAVKNIAPQRVIFLQLDRGTRFVGSLT